MSADNLPPRKWVEAILNAITAARVDGIMGSDSLSSIVYAIEAARKIEDLQRSREAPGREEESLYPLLASAWFYGGWKAETHNERKMQAVMEQAGWWPIANESELLEKLSSSPTVEGGEEEGGSSRVTDSGRGALPTPPDVLLSDHRRYFTLVFEGDLRKFTGNPHLTDTPFGRPVASGLGCAFDEIDELHSALEERDGASSRHTGQLRDEKNSLPPHNTDASGPSEGGVDA